MDAPSRLLAHFAERTQEARPVRIISDNVFAAVSAIQQNDRTQRAEQRGGALLLMPGVESICQGI